MPGGRGVGVRGPYLGKIGKKRVVFLPSLVWQPEPGPVLWGVRMRYGFGRTRRITHSPDAKMTDTPRAPSWPNIWQTFLTYGAGTACSSSP